MGNYPSRKCPFSYPSRGFSEVLCENQNFCVRILIFCVRMCENVWETGTFVWECVRMCEKNLFLCEICVKLPCFVWELSENIQMTEKSIYFSLKISNFLFKCKNSLGICFFILTDTHYFLEIFNHKLNSYENENWTFQYQNYPSWDFLFSYPSREIVRD